MSGFYRVQRKARDVHLGDRISIPDRMDVVGAPIHLGDLVVLPVRPAGARPEAPPHPLPVEGDAILVVEEFA